MTGERVRIGKIVGCHGLRGDLKVRPASDEPSWIGQLKHVYLVDEAKPVAAGECMPVAASKKQGNLVLIRFKGLDSRTKAEPLVGQLLYADFDALPAPEEGEYWAHEVIGLAVLDRNTRRPIGLVQDLLSSGGSDFLEIRVEATGETAVIPFIDPFFPEVDPKNGFVAVDLLADFLASPPEAVTDTRLRE